MTSGSLTVPREIAGRRLPVMGSLAWPLATLTVLLVAQFSLIFIKSFNWDEFFHYNAVYQLREGTLARPFQTLPARFFAWSSYLSDDLVTQMLAARILVWTTFLIGLSALYGVARKFVSREDALWTTLVYLAAGTVFAHGFAIRADPLAMAVLMLALYVLASRSIDWTMVLAVGALIGLAGMLTVKSALYAPCFTGLAWLRLSEAPGKRRALARLAFIPAVAAITFYLVYVLHGAGLAPASQSQVGTSFVANALQWLTDGMLRQPRYTMMAIVTAPVFAYALVSSPRAWREAALSRDRRLALIGLCLPLLVILFYRNVFPYFFVFILAPVAVALAPAVAAMRQRYGAVLLAAAICAVPLVKFMSEPRDVLDRQREIIAYVHRQVPKGAVTLDYSGMIADHPRAIDNLVSGIGLRNYTSRRVPLVAQAVTNGDLAVVIDNRRALSLALAGQNAAEGLLPADVAALHGNFSRAWGPVWLAGEEVPPGDIPVSIEIPHDATYTPADNVKVDGVAFRRGELARLSAGSHVVTGKRSHRTVLWRGNRVPSPGPQTPPGMIFTDF